MINFCGYYNKSDDDNPFDDKDLFVKSCGHYKLITVKSIKTHREHGRRDYQLIYVADGVVHFNKKGVLYHVGKGGFVLYKPNEPQNYYYNLEENPDVYWLHFTGSKVEQMLENMELLEELPMQLMATYDITDLFEKMINELRLTKHLYVELAETHLRQLLISLSRYYLHEDQGMKPSNSLIDGFIYEFERDFKNDINIKEYAARKNISCSWFISEFKRYTQSSPKQYITNLRIQHAKDLLRNLALSVNEISNLVGYNDQFHFSRIFKKYEGISPSEYRDRYEYK